MCNVNISIVSNRSLNFIQVRIINETGQFLLSVERNRILYS